MDNIDVPLMIDRMNIRAHEVDQSNDEDLDDTDFQGMMSVGKDSWESSLNRNRCQTTAKLHNFLLIKTEVRKSGWKPVKL